MTVYLLIGMLAALFLGGLFNPVLGVLGYLVVYVFYNPNIWWGVVLSGWLPRPSFLAMTFLAAGCLLNWKKLELKFSRRERELFFFLATVWIVSLVFGVEVHETTWQYLEKMTKVFIFIFLFTGVIHDLSSYRKVIWILALGGLFLAYQAHGVGQFYDGRLNNIGGTDFAEANAFAAFLFFGIAVFGFNVLRLPLWAKALLIPAIGLMVNALVMTQSRAVFLGAILAVPFVLVRAPKRFRKQVWLYAGLAAVLFFILADTSFWERIGTIGDQADRIKASNSMTVQEELSRIDFWKASVKIFADHPMGVGVKNFEKVVPLYDPRNPGMDAHNTYVLCYTEIGCIGILLFALIVWEAWMQLSGIRRRAEQLEEGGQEIVLHAMTLQVIWVIYMLGVNTTHSNLYSQMTWILLALPICLERALLKLEQARETADTLEPEADSAPIRKGAHPESEALSHANG